MVEFIFNLFSPHTNLLDVGVPEGEGSRGKWYSGYYVS